MEQILTHVRERDCDLLLMRLLESNNLIKNFFLEKVGYSGMNIKSILENQMDIIDGESDLIVLGILKNKKVEILIEDKIDAKAMPEQATRYNIRGRKNVINHRVSDFKIILVCPKHYYEINKEAKKYDHVIFYEEILNILENNNGLKIDIEIIKKAIDKSSGKLKDINSKVSYFWSKMFEYIKESNKYNKLVMSYKLDELKGTNARWINFKYENKSPIILKSEQGNVDIEFKNIDIHTLKTKFEGKLHDNEAILLKGTTPTIQIVSSILNFEEDFEYQINSINKNLDAILRAYEILNLFHSLR